MTEGSVKWHSLELSRYTCTGNAPYIHIHCIKTKYAYCTNGVLYGTVGVLITKIKV